jgi:DNA invertase Pin-like site-specific DNA recombinase
MCKAAYSYGRYSSGQQAKGRSEDRQDQGALAWCKRHGFELDTGTVYFDKGTSAFRGKHRAAGSPLRAFLDDVEAGRIARGSTLILENLDRLSRENPWDAVPLLCQIVNAGVDVATLSPSEFTYARNGDLTGLILAVVEFGRGHSESKSKSDRLADVWAERKRRAREENGIITRRLPAWVREHQGELVPVPERVVIVKRIFALAVAGRGLHEIVKTLTGEKVGPWGRGGSWNKAYVLKILSGRAVLGEHQPRKNGKPDGPQLADYYPRVIDHETWEKAQAALRDRRDRTPGRIGPKVANLFSNLLVDARTGGRVLIGHQTQGPKGRRRRRRMLVPAGALEGRERSVTLPYDVFEAAVLSLLREVTPADVTGSAAAPKSTLLAVEAAALESRMKALEAELDAGDDVPLLARKVREWDARLQAVLRQLAAARQEEDNPAPALLAEAQTLLDVAVDEPRRLRLRSLLSQLVESVHVLIVPRKKPSAKLCAVQIFFRRGTARTFLVYYRAARRGSAGAAGTLAFPEVVRRRDLDLRKKEDAEACARLCAQLQLSDPAGG